MLGMEEARLGPVFDRILDGTYDEAEAVLAAVVARLPEEVRRELMDPRRFAVGTSDLQFKASSIPCDNGGGRSSSTGG
jgi:hypothetical protein